MVVTSEALGAWRTSLATLTPKYLIKQVNLYSRDLKMPMTESAPVSMNGDYQRAE